MNLKLKENYIYKTKHNVTEKSGLMVVTKIEMRDKEYSKGYDLPPYSELIEVGPKEDYPEYFL